MHSQKLIKLTLTAQKNVILGFSSRNIINKSYVVFKYLYLYKGIWPLKTFLSLIFLFVSHKKSKRATSTLKKAFYSLTNMMWFSSSPRPAAPSLSAAVSISGQGRIKWRSCLRLTEEVLTNTEFGFSLSGHLLRFWQFFLSLIVFGKYLRKFISKDESGWVWMSLARFVVEINSC